MRFAGFQRERGFSLVELVVATSLMLAVIAWVFQAMPTGVWIVSRRAGGLRYPAAPQGSHRYAFARIAVGGRRHVTGVDP